jgi:8-oxo-dGTP diphosphatase
MKSDMNRLFCNIHPLGALKTYKYVVVLSHENGAILLSRRRDRATWETQGGHVEPGETPMEAARRELYEESGACEFDIAPLCDYFGYDDESSANGMVFAAEIKSRGPLPESEMAEVRTFQALPQNLTYPNVTPALFQYANSFAPGLGLQAADGNI